MAIRDWLAAFSNDVVEVKEPVATDLEATRFLLRHPRQPVHLRNLQGGEAVGNLWSTRDRVAAALRVSNADLLPKLMDAQAHARADRGVPGGDSMRQEPTAVDLRDLPIRRLFPKDAGRYITAGVWVAEWEGTRNLSFHRILVLGADRGACRIVPRHLRHMYDEAMKAGRELKVAVCIGLDPWNLLAGGTSVEYGVDESRIASALTQSCLGKPVDMVRIKNGLTVPAEAEYVLEGRLIHEVHEEGPFVDAVRTYDRVRKEPVLVVDRIYQRDRPIFHIIVGGLDEHFMFMGMPREPVIYQAVSRAVPHVKAVRLTEGGCAWLHGVVSIRKQHQGDGKKAIMAAFGAHTSMKQVVIVDEDIDIFDDRDVEWAIATRFQADRGLVVLHDVRGSSIDPSARDGFTSKTGIDATKPLGGNPAMGSGPAGTVQGSPLVGPRASPVGTADILVLLIEFTDVVHEPTHDQTFFDRFFNDSSPGAPSMRAFYAEASYGALTINATIVPMWFVSSRTMAYYGQDGSSGVDAANGPIYNLVTEAVRTADPFVNFTAFDTDHNGVLNHLMIIHARAGQDGHANQTDP